MDFETLPSVPTAIEITDRITRWEDLRSGMFSESERPVTEEEVASFADISGDRNRVHFDEKYAASMPLLGGRVAHGALVGGLVTTILREKLPEHDSLPMSIDFKFRRPVKLGEIVKTRFEVIEIDSTKKYTKLACSCFVGTELALEVDIEINPDASSLEMKSEKVVTEKEIAPGKESYSLDELELGLFAVSNRTVTEKDVRGLTEITGDTKSDVVPKVLLCAFVSALVGMKLPGTGALAMSLNLTFPEAAKLEEEITTKVKVTHIRPIKKEGAAVIKLACTCVSGGRTVVEGEVTIGLPPKKQI